MSDPVLIVGHSLVGTTMPDMLATLLPSTRIDAQIINGASLAYNWDHGATAQGVDARDLLPGGDYATLILTEAIPLADAIAGADTYGAAENYASLAWDANPDTRVLIYETWDDVTNPKAFRAALTADLALWQSIVDVLNAARPAGAPEVGMVPGGQTMALLYDTIDASRGLGLKSITQVFEDDIHLNDIGNYLIALVQTATITGQSTVGAATSLTDAFGQPYSGWTPDQANLLQHLAWEAASVAPGADLAAGTVLPQHLAGTSAAETVSAANGDDRIYGDAGGDSLLGKGGRDLIQGEKGSDTLKGGGGADWLYGDSGKDTLSGDGGSDRLSGGAGNDSLTGGDGADVFVFETGQGNDLISDFDPNQGDRLLLSAEILGDTLTPNQIIARHATLTASGVLLDFGSDGSVMLQGLTTTSGLAGQIDLL